MFRQLLVVFAFEEVSIGEGEGTAAGLMTISNGAGLGAGLVVIELSPGVRGS